MSRPSTRAVVETSTVIIAICALGLSVWQGYTTYNHNRLSVMPLVVVNQGPNEQATVYEWEVENTGFGPAILREASLRPNFEDVHLRYPKGMWMATGTRQNVVIPAGEKFVIFKMKMERSDASSLSQDVEFSFDCVSIYEQPCEVAIPLQSTGIAGYSGMGNQNAEDE